MLKELNKAPDFNLTDSEGKSYSISGFQGKKIVLYFYPRDNTSGCTNEATGFRDLSQAISKTGAVILGVSPDSEASHKKFRDKYQLPFLLLSDLAHTTAEAYGAWGEKKMYGKAYMGILRTTFIIDEKGYIIKVFQKVKPDQHAKEVLDFLKSIP